MKRLMYGIQHRCNPLHVYCRLVERGIDRSVSMAICRAYETLVFRWLNWFIIFVVLVCKAKK
ncbi:MAG: hypothetical protein JRI41_10185 [Deltaproteobacteria bacterium]|nr:hypothetical protein [Deltaproteobacteria bacterium]